MLSLKLPKVQLKFQRQIWDTRPHIGRTRSETVYAGMVYRHFVGRFEIIPPLLSGRLLYRYAVHEICSVDCEENHLNCCVHMRFPGANCAKNAFAAGLARGAYSAPPDPLAGFKGPTSKRRGVHGRGGE